MADADFASSRDKPLEGGKETAMNYEEIYQWGEELEAIDEAERAYNERAGAIAAECVVEFMRRR